MKRNSVILFFCVSAVALSPVVSIAQDKSTGVAGASLSQNSVLRHDREVIFDLVAVGKSGDFRSLGAIMRKAPDSRLSHSQGEIFARRIATACGSLKNSNDWKSARSLAVAGLNLLKGIHETNSVDQLERLYWEAWIHAKILADWPAARDLLNAAVAIAPEDDRISRLQALVEQHLQGDRK